MSEVDQKNWREFWKIVDESVNYFENKEKANNTKKVLNLKKLSYFLKSTKKSLSTRTYAKSYHMMVIKLLLSYILLSFGPIIIEYFDIKYLGNKDFVTIAFLVITFVYAPYKNDWETFYNSTTFLLDTKLEEIEDYIMSLKLKEIA